jgi:hypothetical protein
MAKFIDIDSVDTPIGEAKINGVIYTVHNMKIKSLINILSISDKGDDSGSGAHEYLIKTAEALHEMIPECPVSEFLKLSINQLNALMAWTRDIASPGAVEAEAKNEQTPQT